MKRKHLRFAQRMVFAIMLLMGVGSSGFMLNGLHAQTDLAVLSVTHTTSPLVPGDSETFVIEVRNNGILPAAGAIINFDIADVDWVHDNASSPGAWNFLLNGTATRVGLMPGLTTESVTITVRVPSDASHQAINVPPMGPAWASISFAGVDTDSGNNEASTSLTSRIEANLTIEKNLLTPQVAPGGTALYAINVCNDGPSDVEGVGVNDTPGTNLDFGSLQMSPGSDFLYIPAGQCRTVMASATVSASAPVGAGFGNTADIDISNLFDGPGANAAPVVTVGGSAVDNSGVVRSALLPLDLEVVSVSLVGGGPLVPGTTRTFNITARNNGTSDAYGVVLTTLLFDVAYIRNDSNTPAGWSVAGNGGTWMRQTAWPAGQTDNFSLEVIIPSDAHYLAGLPIDDFRAFIAAANPDPNTTNNGQTTFFSCQAQGNLTLNVQTLTSGVSPQGTALFNVRVCNTGPSDLRSLDVDLTLGAGFAPGSLVSSLNPNNLYVPAGQCITMTVSGRVLAGTDVGSNVCLSAAVVANSAANGAGSTLAAQHNTPSDQSCATVQHPLAPADVAIVSTSLVGGGPIVPGTTATFVIEAINNGPADAYGAVLTTLFREVAYSVNNSTIPLDWNAVGSGGTWVSNQPWAPGTTVTFSIQFNIPSNAHYQAALDIDDFWASVGAANPDPNTGNNYDALYYDSQAQADLSIEKNLLTPVVAPGADALYEIVVCNDGPSDIAGIDVLDVPGLNLSSIVLGYSQDLYIAAGQCVTVIAVGEVSVAALPGQSFANTASVDAGGADGGATTLAPIVNEPSDDHTTGLVGNYLPDSDMDVTASIVPLTSPIIAGLPYTFQLYVTNNGPAMAEGVTVNHTFGWLPTNPQITVQPSPPGSPWSVGGNGITASRSGAMPPGTELVGTFQVIIPADAVTHGWIPGQMIQEVSVAASNPDPNLWNNLAFIGQAIENHADLSIEKALINSEIKPGETAIFNIVVNNAGPSDVDQVGFFDVVAPGAGNVSFQYFEPSNINNFYVAAGDSKSFTVSLQVDEDGCGLVRNCAWVIGPGYNSDLFPGNNGPSCDEFFIYDDVDPVAVVCPDDITVDNDPGVCGALVNCEVIFEDNCDNNLDIELLWGQECGTVFPVGLTHVKWQATDNRGNTAICEFKVMVNDTEQPTIECPRDIVIDINASGYATVTEGFANIYSQGPCGVTLTYEPPVADDNCDWIMTNYAGLGAIDNYTVQGFGSYFSAENWDISADGDGFVYTGAAPLSVLLQGANDGTNDAQTRMCITIPVDGTMSFDWYYESTDWSPVFDPFGYELDGVFYELTDPNGPLVQNGQVTINVESGQEFCFVQTSTDGILGPGVTITNLFVFEDVNTPNPQYYEYGGVYTEGWQVVDAAGNQTICNFTITINDNQPPTITCPNNIVVESDPAICGAAVMYAYPLGIDNCPDWYVIQIQGPGPGEVFPLGNTIVEYQITDENGNFTTCNFQVRVVDGEAPTFFECAPDQNIYTSDNGTGDCCSTIPRLTDDVVIGDNCAEGDLPTVALFYDPDYTDTQANCDGEAYNVYQHLINRGFSVVLIDRLEDFGQWSAALGSTNLLVIPALEGNGNFLADMPAGSVDLLLQSFVNTNGGRILMMAGGSGANAAANVMNNLYGYSLTEDCCYNGNTSYQNLVESLYTAFMNGPASIGHHFSTRTVSGLPAVNAKSIYEMSTDGETTVAWFSKGDGQIVYFGWSFRNGGPLCADADTEFTEVLDRALLELAGEGIIVTQSPEAYSTYCGQHGDEIEVVISAIDFDGNESSCTTIVTLLDDEKPVIFPPDPITVDCEDISETADPAAIIIDWLAEAYATDNCDAEPMLTYDFDITLLDICADQTYTITVTWTAVDDAGNVETATSTITVVPDTEAPFLSVPDPITLDCGDISETASPAALIDAWLAEAYATDVCDTDPELSHSFDIGTLDICALETYDITVTWTAVDHCGNTTVLSSTITVVPDTEDPFLYVPDPITLDCGDISETSDPAAIIDAWLAQAYALDNCDTDPTLSHSFEGDQLDICADEPYDITVTWIAQDACYNATILSSTITVVPDTEDPYLYVPDPITLDCGDISETADPAALIDAWLAEAYTTDNCDTDPELAHSFDYGVLDICAEEEYTITVTWTANDACGNTTVLSSTITVVPDTEDPFLYVPDPITLDCDDISETASPAAIIDAWLAEAYTTDNCDTDPELAHDFDYGVLDICADETYVITVTWTANDACGNTTVLSSTITVVPDTEDPFLFVPAPITLDCGELSETADPAAIIDAWLAEAYATDNCDTDPELAYSFDYWLLDICADEEYDLTVTWTANDACGNTTVLSSTITVVPDTDAPVITVPDPLVLDCDDISETTDPSATIDAWLELAYATDNCDTDPELTYDFDITTLDVCVGGTLTVTWTSNDACGNTSTATSTITVIPDTDAPVFVECPTGYTFNNDADKCGANVTWAVPVAEDACTADVVVTQTGGPAQGSFLQVGVIYTVEYTATDGCGNTAICTFPVQVVDMQNPVAICQDVVVYLDPIDGEASITAADADGGSYDNCGIVSWTISNDFFTCDNVGENNVTLTVTDAAGNSEVCVAEVSVIDNTAPTFTCPDPALVSGCDELVPDLVSLVTDAFDNCGVDYIYQNPVAGTDFGNQSGQSIIVTIFVGDVNGNVATCEVEVTIDDTVPPVFTNCPTEMHMIGNDPDQCSGKLNWSIPVATDNCELESITQIAGPPVGSIIPVCQVITITYEAEDASGNTSLCSFEVLVVDTEKPEFDADILMPGDITVECDAIPAPFVLTNNDVNDNCTAPQDLIIEFTETSTQDPNEYNCGHYNYTITRTWTVTDETCIYGGGGNQLIHVQIITVEDTTPPTAVCKNITVTLDKFGNASITGADIDGGSFDNCAPAYTLDLQANPNTFDCSNLGPNEVTLTVTDPCGNSSTCIAIVTVVEGIAPCTPEFAVETECLNNATTLADGQFEELITVKSLAMQTWTVQSSNGLYRFNSPAPPAAPIAVANGTAFTAGHLDGIDNDGNGQVDEADEMIYYTFRAKFVECVGYTATLANNIGQTGTVSNKACYPTPVFVDLFDPFCLSTPPFPIQVVDFYGAEGQIIGVEIDGEAIPAPYLFNALELGEGPHFIKVTFDAGEFTSYTIINGQVVAGSEGETLTNSGCQQMISTYVNVVETPDVVACNDTIYVSLEGDCVSEVTPDMILEGSYFCYDDYTVTISYPLGTTQFNPPNQVNASHIGKVLTVNLSHIISGNMCWGYIVVEDKWKPEITCPEDIVIWCIQDPDDLDQFGHLVTGEPVIFDCTDTQWDFSDEYVQYTCAQNSSILMEVTRTFVVYDEYNNSNSCTQHITVSRAEFEDLDLPGDVDVNCDEVSGPLTPSVTGWPQLGGFDLIPGAVGACSFGISYTDETIDICVGTYQIIRTWKLTDICPEAGGGTIQTTHVQYITVHDVPPTIQLIGQAWTYDPVNDWYLISANSWSPEPNLGCVASGPLPLAIIDGVCNDIVDVTVSTPTGNTTNGGLIPYPGLPIGQHLVTYIAQDECGNVTTLTVTINVLDNVVPTAICDEITDVNLSGDGFAVVNATTFDDGSYDNCCLAYFEARRMDGDCEGNFDDFGPTVEFCCVDAGQSIMVVFRAYDCYGNFNDCMVSVNVNDKLPPIIISCPAPQTITCDTYLQNYAAGLEQGDFDVLNGFGSPVFYDNCQLDVTHNVTTNIDNCSKGTITRSWTAQDATNVPVTCTQIITVQHVSDWVVEFPANVTVECIDGQLPDTGEPEIFFDECELIAVSFEDQTFTVVPDACYKIERTWTVINWCVYEQFGEDLYSESGKAEQNLNVDWDGDGDKDNRTFRDGYNSSGSPGIADGFITWKQVIKVVDEDDPSFTVPQIDGCIVDTDCDMDLVLPFPVITDECSPNFDVDITGDFGTFNNISGDVTIPDVGVGEYEVTYAVTDNCGNTAYETITITVEDCKKPTPLCDNGLVVEIMQTQMVAVDAEAFDEGSFDNCGPIAHFSYSSDITNTTQVFDCDDVLAGQVAVQIWVTDIYGNQDFCETFLFVQDNMGFCGGGTPIVIAGEVATEEQAPVEGVTVEMNGGLLTQVTGLNGQFNFSAVAGNDYTVTPMLDENAANGVTTFDMVLITRHVLNVDPLDSPYKIIAADANNSGTVTTLDLVAIRKVILFVEDNFPNNTSWRFVDKDFSFPNPQNPWAAVFPEVINYNNLTTSDLEADFVAIKVGDVNGSAATTLDGQADQRTMMGDLLFHTKDMELKEGQVYNVPFYGNDQAVSGYQFTLELGEGIELLDVAEGLAKAENFGFALLEEGALTTSWNEADARVLGSEEAIFTLVIKANENTTLSKELSTSSRYTAAEAYSANGDLLNVQLTFGNEVAAGFELYQNIPNPFTGVTRIGFRLPEPAAATLTVMDASGKVVRVIKGEYGKGYNEVNLSDFGGVSGVLYYQLDTPTHSATRKMVILE